VALPTTGLTRPWASCNRIVSRVARCSVAHEQRCLTYGEADLPARVPPTAGSMGHFGTSGLGGEGASRSVIGTCGRSVMSSVRTDSQPDRPGSDVEVEPHGHLPLRR
jgi:hypothetical protein